MPRATQLSAIVLLLASSCASPVEGPGGSDLLGAGCRMLAAHDPAGALANFDEALATEASAVLHAGRGRALQGLGRSSEARMAFEKAIEIDPENASWHVGLGVVEIGEGNFGAAIAACDAAIRRDPREAKAYYNRGCAILSAGDFEQAVADFSSAIRWNPELASAHNGLGVSLASLGRLTSAVEAFQIATSLGALPEAHGNCAAAFYAQGEVQLALAELNTAIRLGRSNPAHLASRGQIYMDLGEPVLAAADFEAARQLAPGDPGLAELLVAARAARLSASSDVDGAGLLEDVR